VREIELGQKPAGFYLTSDSAIYWDAKNEKGESVASGLYFYKLTAGRFSDVKSMVIRR
jgi:flagellar hook assembly protein FlgD